MGLFRNALDGPLTGKKILGIVVYTVLSLISIWATSESIHTSFAIPKVVCYLLGTAFVITLAQLLSVVKDSVEDRRVKYVKLLFVAIIFLVLWAISLGTNAHKLFTQLKLRDIRKNELTAASIALENIDKKGASIGNEVVNNYELFVVSRIQDYKKEVTNINNCGHGAVADTLMSKVQRSMPGSIFTIPSGRPKTTAGCRKLANDMADLMTTELNQRVDSMRYRLSELQSCNDSIKRFQILSDLKEKNSFLTDFASLEVKETISKAHEYYNQLYICYNEGLIENTGGITEFSKARTFDKTLELPVPSINLEKISALIPFVKNQPKDNPGFYFNSLLLSLAIAFVLDIAAFIIFYFVILKKD
ncbi:MAG: hypothetical protein AAGB24_05730 [Bacteroidota bacterium]